MAYLVIYEVPYAGYKVKWCETRADVEEYLKTIPTYERSQSDIEIFTISSVIDEATFLTTPTK